MLSLLVLELGLFFVGMQSVGTNLRQLTGPTFRSALARTTGSPWLSAGLGVVFGALMQSATAVTFILISMVGSGLLTAAGAMPVIVWANVGLTALAFLATLNIHPLVAWLVGVAGIAAGMMRRPLWRAAAGVLLGIGLILFGLETMGEGAAPLQQTAWFQAVLGLTAASPLVAFVGGIAAALLLQSNTGAALLIITLAGTGAFTLPQAMMLIYGTNLGAIGLRLLLSAGLKGTALQLVRLEDLYCLWSGLLMATLFALEAGPGVPLVRAAVTTLTPDLKTQLAVVFLLSNLLPAATITPVLGTCRALLARLWPDVGPAGPDQLQFFTPQARADPATALDLLSRELARLLGTIRVTDPTTPAGTDEAEPSAPSAFDSLSTAIGSALRQLATDTLHDKTATRLHLIHHELTLVHDLEEGMLAARHAVGTLPATPQTEVLVNRMVAV